VKGRKGELRKALEVAVGLRRELGLLRGKDPIYKALRRIESLEGLDPLGGWSSIGEKKISGKLHLLSSS